MKKDDFVTIETSSEDSYKVLKRESNDIGKEKMLFAIAVLTFFVAALLVAGSLLSKAGSGNEIIIMPTKAVTKTPLPTAKHLQVTEEIKSIDDLYASGVLSGTDYENKRFYCSDITPYYVKQKTGCRIFMFWDTLDTLVVHNDKLIEMDLYSPDRIQVTKYEEIPEIHVSDFSGDGTYELIFTVTTYIKTENNDKNYREWGTKIVLLDLETMQQEVIEEIRHSVDEYVYLRDVSENEFEVFKYVSNVSVTDDVYMGKLYYDNKIVYKTKYIDDFVLPVPIHSNNNIDSVIWSENYSFDLDNDGKEEKYTFMRSANMLVFKNESDEELASQDVGWLFLNSSVIRDVVALDMNNDGNKEMCIVSTQKLGNDRYMTVVIVLSNVGGKYRINFRASHLQELEFKKVDTGIYDLYWCVNKTNIPIKITDESFYNSAGDMILRVKANIPRSHRFEIVDGVPVLIIEWSMYIDGYTGRLETLITGSLCLTEKKFDAFKFELEIESSMAELISESK